MDVAFTEAAVGAGISTVLMLTVLALTRAREAVTPRRRLWPAGSGRPPGGMLIYASQDLPAFGRPDTAVQTHPVTEAYLEASQDEIGVPNTVAASWRATAATTPSVSSP